MAERSGFFNSTPENIREYTDKDWANYFSKFLSDGIYVENNQMGLKVISDGSMNITIQEGSAYIQGFIYENTTPLAKVIEPSDPYLNRIDRVVLRLDELQKTIKVDVKKGVPAGTAVPPGLVDETMLKELSLAQIKVNAGSSSIVIEDERLTEYCGMVTLLISAPFEDMFEQWEEWKTITEGDYRAWLDILEEALDGNTAGNLLNLINKNTSDIDINKEDILANITALNSLGASKLDKSSITISPNNPDVDAMENGDLWFKYI